MIKVRLDEGYAVDFQDAMSRFTLDSATEFLFGFSVHSMSTGIPYPHNAPDHLKFPPNVNGFGNPGTDAFAKAFLEAQFRISQRIRNGWVWPVNDVFKDQTTESMEVVNRFVEPIVKEAVKKNGRNFGAAKVDGKGGATMDLPAKEREVGEDETLLDHLVKYTTGAYRRSHTVFALTNVGYRLASPQRGNDQYPHRRTRHHHGHPHIHVLLPREVSAYPAAPEGRDLRMHRTDSCSHV